MPRYIDTEELLKVPNVRNVCEYDETGEFISYKAVPVEAIENATTVDAVEVVRCKDCVQSETLAVVTVNVFCNEWATCVSCDGFCHLGVKKNAAD